MWFPSLSRRSFGRREGFRSEVSLENATALLATERAGKEREQVDGPGLSSSQLLSNRGRAALSAFQPQGRWGGREKACRNPAKENPGFPSRGCSLKVPTHACNRPAGGGGGGFPHRQMFFSCFPQFAFRSGRACHKRQLRDACFKTRVVSPPPKKMIILSDRGSY